MVIPGDEDRERRRLHFENLTRRPVAHSDVLGGDLLDARLLSDGGDAGRELLADVGDDLGQRGHDAEVVGKRELNDVDAVFFEMFEVLEDGRHVFLVVGDLELTVFFDGRAILRLCGLRGLLGGVEKMQRLGGLLHVVGKEFFAVVVPLCFFGCTTGTIVAILQSFAHLPALLQTRDEPVGRRVDAVPVRGIHAAAERILDLCDNSAGHVDVLMRELGELLAETLPRVTECAHVLEKRLAALCLF